MEQGTIIAVRGSGPRHVELRYDTTVGGVDFGVMVSANGATSTVTPIVAALAKGYWQAPPRPSVTIAFAPGLTPILKMTRSEAGRYAANERWQGAEGAAARARIRPRDKFKPLKSGPRQYSTDDPTQMKNLSKERRDEQKAALKDTFPGMTPRKMDANLQALYERAQGSGAVQAGSNWYEDGGAISARNADRNGLSREHGTAVTAAMSPMREWEDNVAVGDYVMGIATKNPTIPDLTGTITKGVKGQDGKTRPVTRSVQDWVQEEFDKKGLGQADTIKGKRFADLTLDQQGVMVRIGSQAGYFTSDGQPLSFITTNKAGAKVPRKVSWPSGDGNSVKALQIARADDPVATADALLEGTKVRSFYNNLTLGSFNPRPDVTMDTHAMSAAVGKIYAAGSPEGGRFFGGPPSNAEDGYKGLYPVFADSYRRVADANGVSPHQMQAILWLQWRNETDGMPLITHTEMGGTANA